MLPCQRLVHHNFPSHPIDSLRSLHISCTQDDRGPIKHSHPVYALPYPNLHLRSSPSFTSTAITTYTGKNIPHMSFAFLRALFSVPIPTMFRLPFALPFLATLFSSTLLSLVQAQIGGIGSTPLFSNTTCLTGPNTTFVNCNTFYSALVDCTSNTTETVAVGCECRQSFFDLVIG